jgi:ADP-ribosylglycohydrolase
MESYVACSGFDASDFARRIADLFTENRIVGRGHATEEAVLRLSAGIPWTQSGTPAPAAGNASAIRAGVLGLIYGDQPDTLIRLAHEQGMITHADPRCSAGAVALAGAIALASRNVHPDGAAFLTPLCQWCQQIEPTLASGLRRLKELLRTPKEQAAEAISRIGLPPGVDSQWRGGISAFVVSSVLWSLYAFLKHPDDFSLAVALAIEAGGDVDTTAAMAGAMVGARLGLAALPSDLAAHLNDRGTWRKDDLIALATACFETAKSK